MARHLHAVLDDDDWDRLERELKPDSFTWKRFVLEAGEVFKEHADPELYETEDR